MKNLFLITAIALLAFSCGDAGFGLNVAKEFPVDVPISFDIPGNPFGGVVDVDPPAKSFDYDLNEVGSFSDALDGLEGVFVNGMAYEIEGVPSNANIDLQLLRINVDIAGQPLTLLEITEGGLTNTPKTEIQLTDLQKDNIVDELFNQERINADVKFDLGSVPTDEDGETLEFTFRVYFDVGLKARNLEDQ